MSLRQQAARGVFWSGLRIWGSQASNLLVFLVLSRLLGPEAFGLVALASVFVAFVQIFLDQGFSAAIIQHPRLEQAHLDTAFWSSLLIGGLLTLGGVALAGPIAALFREPRLAPIIAWLALTFLLYALCGVQQSLLQRAMAFKRLAMRSFAAKLIAGAVSVAMAFAGFGVWSLVADSLLTALISVLMLWRMSDWRPGLRFSLRHFRELFGFGLHIVSSKFLDFFNRRADDFLIGYFLGPTALGYYAVAYRVLLIMINLLTSISNEVAFPTFARLQHDIERMRRAFYTVTQMTSLIAFPAFLGVAALAPDLVRVLFGAQWMPSVPVMQILALVGMLQSVQYFNGSLINAAGQPFWRPLIMLANAVANVIAFAVAVRWGIVAVAAAYGLVACLLAPLPLLVVRRLVGITFGAYLRNYVAPLTGSAAALLAVMSLQHTLLADASGVVRLAISLPLWALVYVATIRLTAPALVRQTLQLVQTALPRVSLRRAPAGPSGK